MANKMTAVLMISVFLGALTACGSAKAQAQNASSVESTSAGESASAAERESVAESSVLPAASAQGSSDTPSETGKDTLVVYFSATGTTRGVAEKIADIEDADLYEILAAKPYTDADLNWSDSDSRTTKEQNDSSVRPEIGSEPIDLSSYSRIYVGYPIWWGEEPRIMDTFVESYDFGDATVIPFCTSSSSGIGRSGKNLADLAGSGNWLDGERFSGSVSEDELRTWINGLK